MLHVTPVFSQVFRWMWLITSFLGIVFNQIVEIALLPTLISLIKDTRNFAHSSFYYSFVRSLAPLLHISLTCFLADGVSLTTKSHVNGCGVVFRSRDRSRFELRRRIARNRLRFMCTFQTARGETHRPPLSEEQCRVHKSSCSRTLEIAVLHRSLGVFPSISCNRARNRRRWKSARLAAAYGRGRRAAGRK